VDDGTPVSFASSRGVVSFPTRTTVGGVATDGLTHPDPFDLTARIRTRAALGAVEDRLDVYLVPDADDAGSIELAMTPTAFVNDGVSEFMITAHVRKPDGTDADDGTRVFVALSAGTPESAFAETSGGMAAIHATTATAPGPFEVRAWAAGSVVSSSKRAAYGPAGSVAVTFELQNAAGVGSLDVDISFPAGATPVLGTSGVEIELIGSDEGGIAGDNALAFAGQPGAVVRVSLIDFDGLMGDGPIFRIFFDLPPGGEVDCDPFGIDLSSITDVDGSPIAAGPLVCSGTM
jgi:hypothetical protein